MSHLDWKQEIRRNLECAKQGKPKIVFNANLYNEIVLRRNQNRQAAVANDSQTKADEKEDFKK